MAGDTEGQPKPAQLRGGKQAREQSHGELFSNTAEGQQAAAGPRQGTAEVWPRLLLPPNPSEPSGKPPTLAWGLCVLIKRIATLECRPLWYRNPISLACLPPPAAGVPIPAGAQQITELMGR